MKSSRTDLSEAHPSRVGLLLFLLLAGCNRHDGSALAPLPVVRKPVEDPFPVPSSEELRGATLWRDDVLPIRCSNCPPQELRFRAAAVSNLLPDRRFLYALLEIRALEGRPVKQLALLRQGPAWALDLDGVRWGLIEELPDFERLFSAVRGEARARPRSSSPPIDVAPGAPLVPVNLAKHLRSLDAFWAKSPGDPALAASAARAFTYWSLLSRDRTGGSDALFGKALALLAVARQGGRPLPAEEALLAHAMGYRAAAWRLAKGLSEDDPVRAFCGDDAGKLQRLTAEGRGSREAQVLLVTHQARTRGRGALFGTLASSPLNEATGIGVAHVLLDLSDFGTKQELLSHVEQGVFEELEHLSLMSPGSAAPGNLATMTRAFERAGTEAWGPLLDASTLRGFYRGTYVTAAADSLRFELESRGDEIGATQSLAALETADPMLWEGLHSWLSSEVAFHKSSSTRAGAALASAMLRSDFGPLLMEGLHERIKESQAAGAQSTDNRDALPGAFARLDARPDRVASAVVLVAQHLRDLNRRDALYESILRRAPGLDTSTELEAARNLKGTGRLEHIANDATVPGWVRVDAVLALEDISGGRKGNLEKRLETVVAQDAERGTAVFDAARALRERGDVPGALRLVDRFLDLRPVPQDPLWANARATKAYYMRRLGRSPEEVWAVVEPALEVGTGWALDEGVRCQIALGNLDRAADLARALSDRYRSGAGVRSRAEVEWAKGKPEAAALLLAQEAARVGRTGFYEDLPRALEGVSAETRAAALDALCKVTLDGLYRHDLAVGLLEGGDAAAACDVAGGPVSGTGAASLVPLIRYRACRAAGRGKAVIEELVGGGRSQSHELALTAFHHGVYDALWDLFPDGRMAGAAKPGALAFARAAALLDGHVENAAERREGLLQWARTTQDGFGPYVRLLLGDLAESDLPRPGETAMPTYGFSLGLMALSRCEPEVANEWLQVALWGNNVPASWSYELTDRLLKTHTAIALLSARDLSVPTAGKARP